MVWDFIMVLKKYMQFKALWIYHLGIFHLMLSDHSLQVTEIVESETADKKL
jgi:hypothetical protein